ncbi:MAG: nucleoid-associated protein [Bacteroidales bacterium]|nr:nucleoid-associated protein [Bacteroidales bacterium]
MMTCDDAVLERLVLHRVGNKANNESLHLSKAPYVLNSDISGVLLKYFTTPFKGSQYYVFSDERGFNNNKVYTAVKKIFENPSEDLYSASCDIAKHLFDVSLHPNIKAGELYVTYLQNCYLDGDIVDAVGIFKSETRQTYIKIYPDQDDFSIQSDEGIDINKLDKGCIVFNKEEQDGYVVSIVDTISRGNEAVYWVDEFLNLMQRQDSYFKTDNMLNVCRNFVTEYLPQEYEMTRMDQADLLNRNQEFFKENKNFDTDSYSDKVFGDDEFKQQFIKFKQQYEDENGMQLTDNFVMSDEALKRASRYLRSVIKLDKNFTIYIHGKREMVETGEDEEKGLRYYKFYFNKES